MSLILGQMILNARGDGQGGNIGSIVGRGINEMHISVKDQFLAFMKNLTFILTFLDTSTNPKKIEYLNFIESQWTRSERLLMFYYSLSADGYDNMRNIINVYGLLRNLDPATLYETEDQQYLEEGKIKY